jgi:hypothetical protein
MNLTSPRTLAAVFAAVLGLGAAGSASAQEWKTGAGAGVGPLGVGVAAMLTGPFGPQVVYDAGVFHVEGIVGFQSNDATTDFDIGGRFFYHVHASQAADFSLGAGLGVTSSDPDGPAEGTTNVHIDIGPQLRAFVVPNVAVSATAGLAIITGDADNILITGDLVGTAGITYYF